MKKVVVDVFGGDHAPQEIVNGCLIALENQKDFSIVMVGKEQEIKNCLLGQTYDESRIEIVDAVDVITNDDTPTVAIRTKKQSSLVVAYEYLKNNDDAIGLVSAGSTGAVLTGATLKVGRIKGVSRPALAPLLPTVIPDKKVMLVDCGANVDCKPHMLLQFAQMGNAFCKSVLKIENPKIGLLCNGTEDHKGNELTHETFQLLKASNLNFVGNMEARDILSGEYDVVVSDGFYGNVALKTCEGTALAMFSIMKKAFTANCKRKIGAALLKPAFKEVKKIMDYNESGGAPFLGVKKLVVKAHGSSKGKAFSACIKQIVDFDNDQLIDLMKTYFENAQTETQND